MRRVCRGGGHKGFGISYLSTRARVGMRVTSGPPDTGFRCVLPEFYESRQGRVFAGSRIYYRGPRAAGHGTRSFAVPDYRFDEMQFRVVRNK